MAQDMLVTYVKDNLAKGYSEDQIKTFLQQQGYDDGRVQAAIEDARSVPPTGERKDALPTFESQGNFFSRSFMLLKSSWSVVKKNKSILLFPLLAGLFSLIFIVTMLFPSIINPLLSGSDPESGVGLLLVFGIYLGLAFIATFFNVCVVYIAKESLRGKTTGFGAALGFAFSKFHLIIGWSLVSATVGLLMHFLERLAQKLPLVGYLIILVIQKIIGLLWSVLSLFAIPAMVVEDIGPFPALKSAGRSLRKTWGEGFVMYFGLGGVYFLFIIVGGLIFAPLAFFGAAGGLASLLIVGAVAFVYFLAGILLFSVVNKVFFTALYLYSSTGAIPDGFPPSMIQSAFKPKKKK